MTVPTTTTVPPSRRPRAHRVRRWRLVGAASLLLVPSVLVACGDSDSSASGSSDSSSPNSEQASNSDMEAYRSCLAEHGVELPTAPDGGGAPGDGGPPSDGGSSGTPPSMPDIDQEAFAKAQEACADVAPAAGAGGGFGGGGPGGANSTEMQAYRSCLTDNGVTLPDRSQAGQGAPSGTPPAAGSSGGTPFGLDESDPTVAAAVAKCAPLLPERPTGGGGGAAS